jgi:hypothetical protein
VFFFCSMTATALQPLADRYPTSFEEFRELWEAEGTRKGLAGLLQRMISRLLTALVAMLADGRAAKVEGAQGVADNAEAVADAAPAAVACADGVEDREADVRPRREECGADARSKARNPASRVRSTRPRGEVVTRGAGGRGNARAGAACDGSSFTRRLRQGKRALNGGSILRTRIGDVFFPCKKSGLWRSRISATISLRYRNII